MGALSSERDVVFLLTETLAGRADGSWLRLHSPTVSQHHALILWRTDGWWLKDLGSKNGSQVGGSAVEPHGQIRLDVGTEIRFGRDERVWRMTDAGPPRAQGRSESGRRVVGTSHLLELPDDRDPTLLVFRDPHRGWMLQHPDNESPSKKAGSTTSVSGEKWKLYLPDPLEETPHVGDFSRLDQVDLFLRKEGGKWRLEVLKGDSSHRADLGWEGKILWALSEAVDEAGEDQPEAGWMTTEALAEQVQVSKRSINVATQRLRSAIEDLGILDATQIVRVRPGYRKAGSRRIRRISDDS
ncbi:MAG TPA: FHA domain-containing protein [Myxococcales bacterium LLY-WYZ-16_1]|jgi:hypothetical protein|nr:FHA domain-containing protein [Myxococcales bacterium LLY-WYZ-16_1]